MSSNSHHKAPTRGRPKSSRPKRGKLSAQNRYNRECRRARMLLLRKYPDELRKIVRDVEREGWSPRVQGVFVQEKTKRKPKAAAFTLLRLETEKESNHQDGH